MDEYLAANSQDGTKLADFTVATKLKGYSELSTTQVYSECADHLYAGVETTGDTLCFLMWHISQLENLPIQRKLQAELQSAFKNNLSDSEIHKLPYLNAVIEEGLRLFTAAANYLPRCSPPTGATIDGYFIPKGVLVSAQPYTVHRSGHHFAAPDTFDPERWLPKQDERNPPSSSQAPTFLAFGYGSRSCIGKKYVLRYSF